jgi:hypothetical protein
MVYLNFRQSMAKMPVNFDLVMAANPTLRRSLPGLAAYAPFMPGTVGYAFG